uniref:ISXO2-like transposase domain-containing protein n=1 Tax=Panagrolaimus sp. PS1159 TaxID=55785 RepID=A0AC35GY06_9BILA
MDELRNLTNRSFYNLLNKSDEELEQWLIDKRLLPGDSCTCECGGTMNKRNRGAKGVTYRCTSKNCRKEKGRRKGTFFERSNLSYDQILELSYLFANDEASVKNVLRNLTKSDGKVISNRTITDWKNFFRDLCQNYFVQNPVIIGGPGIVVQIDETVITKRKYNRGRMPSSEKWFFGGIEVGSGRAFICPVERRTRDVLIPLIQKHIAPGSIIHSD